MAIATHGEKMIMAFGEGDINYTAATDPGSGDSAHIVFYVRKAGLEKWSLKMYFRSADSLDNLVASLKEFKTLNFKNDKPKE